MQIYECYIQISDIPTSFHVGYFAVFRAVALCCIFVVAFVLCEVTKCHKRIQFEVELVYASVFINVKSSICAHSYMRRVAIVAFCVITKRASLCIP